MLIVLLQSRACPLTSSSSSASSASSSTTMGEIELSCRAYVKMHLHACLFPRCSVNGLLLSSTASSAGGAVCVTDCVPLLHSHLSLAPITQLALTQVCGGQGPGCEWVSLSLSLSLIGSSGGGMWLRR